MEVLAKKGLLVNGAQRSPGEVFLVEHLQYFVIGDADFFIQLPQEMHS